MTSKVGQVLRIFNQIYKENNSLKPLGNVENLNRIKALIAPIKKEDLKFDDSMISAEAPVTFIKIYDDEEVVSASIFGLNEGKSLPIHNHPEMYGFVKCLSGCLEVSSYTMVEPQKNEVEHAKDPKVLKSPIYVKKESMKVVQGDSDEVLHLTPTKGNFHTISVLEGPAAFLDFLAPPYHTGRPERQCHYFNIHTNDEPGHDTYTFTEVECPDWYWCKDVPYRGPVE